ncbi:MAG: 16S rRNA processing protein RimM [Rhodospirillales bacterium]|nr:16S rRNA processing protein RimM [Rhodospirillales bacterium]
MAASPILLGVIGRPHGVRGLVHVTSYTDPPEALAEYGWLDASDGTRLALAWRGEGLAELRRADGSPGGSRIADREAAARLVNLRLSVPRERLSAPDADEFYLADLVGLAATDASGAALGQVAAVHDYGAGASLEIARAGAAPLLVPFTRAAVPEVDIAGGRIRVAPPVAVDGEARP